MENKKVMFEFRSDVNRVHGLGNHMIGLIRGHIEKLVQLNDISCYMKPEESESVIARAQMNMWIELVDYALQTINTPNQFYYLKEKIDEIERSGEFCDEHCSLPGEEN